MHEESDDVLRQIAKNFISEYYDALQYEPGQLYKFYEEDSMYKRHHEVAVYGVENIKQLFNRDNFKYCCVKVADMDFMSIAPWTFNVHVKGTISIESVENGARDFVHNFVIKMKKRRYCDKIFYIRNEIFCFDNYSAIKQCYFPNNNLGLSVEVTDSNSEILSSPTGVEPMETDEESPCAEIKNVEMMDCSEN